MRAFEPRPPARLNLSSLRCTGDSSGLRARRRAPYYSISVPPARLRSIGLVQELPKLPHTLRVAVATVPQHRGTCPSRNAPRLSSMSYLTIARTAARHLPPLPSSPPPCDTPLPVRPVSRLLFRRAFGATFLVAGTV